MRNRLIKRSMLWPTVYMVQASFEVFAYRSKFLFLARCNLGFQEPQSAEPSAFSRGDTYALLQSASSLAGADTRVDRHLPIYSARAILPLNLPSSSCQQIESSGRSVLRGRHIIFGTHGEVIPWIGYPSSIPKCARSDRRSGFQKVRSVRECCTGAKCRRDVNRFG
jgi:hypothetical protein